MHPRLQSNLSAKPSPPNPNSLLSIWKSRGACLGREQTGQAVLRVENALSPMTREDSSAQAVTVKGQSEQGKGTGRSLVVASAVQDVLPPPAPSCKDTRPVTATREAPASGVQALLWESLVEAPETQRESRCLPYVRLLVLTPGQVAVTQLQAAGGQNTLLGLRIQDAARPQSPSWEGAGCEQRGPAEPALPHTQAEGS